MDVRRAGTCINDKWVLEKRIAQGGMSTVWAAVHRTTGFRAAIKILDRDASRREEVLARFEREGRLSNLVDHEGIVKVIDDGWTADGCPCLVMEMLDGQNLDERRLESPGAKMPLDEVVELSLAIADILAAAHAAGLVHRDVKPPNVFITKSGRVKLLDFGVAGARQTSDDDTLTGAGCGTPRFMAPEQLTGSHRIDARADVFALATTMYRLLAAEYPYPANSVIDYLTVIERTKPVRLDRVCPNAPPPLANVLERALAGDPEARYSDAALFAQAIRDAMKPALETTAVSPHTPIRTPAMPSRPPCLGADARDATLSMVTAQMRSPIPPPPPPTAVVPIVIPRAAPAHPRSRAASMPTMNIHRRPAPKPHNGVVAAAGCLLAVTIASLLVVVVHPQVMRDATSILPRVAARR